MKKTALAVLAGLLGAATLGTAETWKGVAVMDTACVKEFKADPDKHTTECALQCSDGGYGLITAGGTFVPFDAAGNEKTIAVLKATKKTDHLRATVEGERSGDTIKVKSISLQ